MTKIRLMAAFCVALALAGGTAAGCGGDDDDGGGGGQQEDLTVGVSLASPTIPLYVAMAKGIRTRTRSSSSTMCRT